MKANVRHSVVLYLLASSLFLTACGSSNSSSPNPAAGNIPNLATKPSAQASTLKTQRFTGTVIDGNTLEPIDKAEIILSAQPEPTATITPTPNNSSNNTPNNTSTPFPKPVPTPPSSGSGTTPASIPTPSAPPFTQPSVTSPSTLPSPTPSTGFSVEGSIPTIPTAVPPEPVQPDASSPAALLGAKPVEVITRYVGSQAVTPINSAVKNTLNLFETNSNNRGKFFINDVPEGKYAISVSAPGYRSITLTDIDPNRLEIPLIPLENNQMMDIVGSVLSPTDTPTGDAFVSSSFPMGSAIGVPASSNSLGEFKLPAVPFGRRSFIAFVQNADGDIRQMGLLKNIIVNNKSIKDQELVIKEKPDTLPGPDGTPKPTTEELIENVNKILTEASAQPVLEKEVSPYNSAPEVSESPIISPPIEPYPAPSDAIDNPLTETIEENQETVNDKKSQTVFDSVKSFFTGKKEDENEAIKIAPVISLRSVIESMVLSGKVQVPEGYTLKSMDVYLTLEPEEKGAHPEEAYLLTQTFTAPASAEKSLISKGNQLSQATPSPSPSATVSASNNETKEPLNFRVNLPVPSRGQKYHLQFTATHADGGLTYHHIYNLDNAADTLSVDFLPVMSKLEIQGESDNTIPTSPTMAWSAVPGAEIYHVTLTQGSNVKRKVIWEGWTKSTQIDYPFSSRALRLKEQETYVLAVSALKGLKPVVNKSNNASAHPGYQAVWSDLSRVTHIPFEVVQ